MLRRLAGLDGSQGTSADNEVAVGATAGARVVRSPGRTGTGTVGLQRCRVDVVVVVVVVEAGAESVSGCSGRPPNTGPTAGSSERNVRPSSAFVEQ